MYFFSFPFTLDRLFMYLRSCDHIVIANLIVLSPVFTCVVSFSILYLYAILYFCFTLRCHDEFCLKCFRNIGC